MRRLCWEREYSQAGTILLTLAVTKLTPTLSIDATDSFLQAPFVKRKWDERRHRRVVSRRFPLQLSVYPE